jgi:hypothetical protein
MSNVEWLMAVSGVERFHCSILTCSAARVRRLGSFFQIVF